MVLIKFRNPWYVCDSSFRSQTFWTKKEAMEEAHKLIKDKALSWVEVSDRYSRPIAMWIWDETKNTLVKSKRIFENSRLW